MKESKLFQLLQLLSEADWKALKQWIDSPWANTNKNLVTLYGALEKGFPDFEGKKWEKEAVFKKVFLGKPYHNRVFNNLLSKFNTEVKKFLSHQRLAQDADVTDYFFVSELMERKATDLLEKNAKALIEQVSTKQALSAKDYWLLFQLHHQLYYQPSAKIRHDSTSNILEKAQHFFGIYSELNQLKMQHDLQIRAAMLKEVKVVPIEEKPVLPIALLINRLERPKNWAVSDYREFKALYYDAFNDLAPTYQQYFLFCCINDSVNLSGVDGVDAIKELFEHYQFGFQHNILLQYGQMTATSFNNILLVASHLEMTEFAQTFFEQYHAYVEKELSVDAFHWGKGQLYYIEAKYEEAIETIDAYRFSSNFFKTQAIGIALKAKFESFLNDNTQYDALLNFCQAKEKSMQRSKIYSKNRRISYIRFIQFLRRLTILVDAKDYTTKKKIGAFQSEIENIDRFFGKGWLLKKIESLFL